MTKLSSGEVRLFKEDQYSPILDSHNLTLFPNSGLNNPLHKVAVLILDKWLRGGYHCLTRNHFSNEKLLWDTGGFSSLEEVGERKKS